MHMYDRENAVFIGNPNTDTASIINKVTLRSKAYFKEDITTIVNQYKEVCTSVCIDWVLAFSQCLHETDWLSSWWCERPRRNPCGYGVNGIKKSVNPHNTVEWAYNPNILLWEHGYSFPSWKEASTVHIAHLLCYVYTDEEMTEDQLALSNKSMRKAAIPANYRGSSKYVKGLTQRWAVSRTLPPAGQQYHNKIIAIANRLIME